jgi:SAM-dependent methyltransferase
MAETFRDFEHRGWEDAAVCAQYDDYFERLTTQSIGALLDAVRVGSSDNVLDVATGPGYVAGFAASRAARVVGLDFSAQQLDLARRRSSTSHEPGRRQQEPISGSTLINGLVREPVSAQGVCAGTVNLSKSGGCARYPPIT